MTDKEMQTKIEEHRKNENLTEFVFSVINTGKTDDIISLMNELSTQELEEAVNAYREDDKKRSDNLKKAIENCKSKNIYVVASKIQEVLDKIEETH